MSELQWTETDNHWHVHVGPLVLHVFERNDGSYWGHVDGHSAPFRATLAEAQEDTVRMARTWLAEVLASLPEVPR